jgi:flagellar biosynthesis GTPase FlhF
MIKFFNNYCSRFKFNNKILIDEEFPKDKLIKIFQPYLLVYLTSLYSMNPNLKSETQTKFKQIMAKFNNFNPQFGRKKYKILFKHNKNFKKVIIGKIIEFDDNHITFNNSSNDRENFLTDHLVYNDEYNVLNYLFNSLLMVNEETNYFQVDEERQENQQQENQQQEEQQQEEQQQEEQQQEEQQQEEQQQYQEEEEEYQQEEEQYQEYEDYEEDDEEDYDSIS